MPEDYDPSPSVIVGIDGSRSAIDAAIWAIDEAVDRDLPMRLVYALDPSMARDVTAAEAALQEASMTVEAVGRPVKVEVAVVHDRCVDALVAASCSAVLICLGARGSNGAHGRRVGSTVVALLDRARCPVAIIRRSANGIRSVAVEFDGSAQGDFALARAFEEARIRSAPLRVLAGRRPSFPEIQDLSARAEISRLARADLERSLARWRALYPEVDVRAVAVPGNPVNYLARHINSIGLLVVGHESTEELLEFAGPGPCSQAGEVTCSVLVCEDRPTPSRDPGLNRESIASLTIGDLSSSWHVRHEPLSANAF